MTELYTAGSYNREKHLGGWGVLLVDNDSRTLLSGMEADASADRMELTAAISGIETLPPGSHLTITSDNQYLVYTMTQGWRRWQDYERWDRLDGLCRERVVDWVWRQHRQRTSSFGHRQSGSPVAVRNRRKLPSSLARRPPWT